MSSTPLEVVAAAMSTTIRICPWTATQPNNPSSGKPLVVFRVTRGLDSLHPCSKDPAASKTTWAANGEARCASSGAKSHKGIARHVAAIDEDHGAYAFMSQS
jgi:hypothetical protein